VFKVFQGLAGAVGRDDYFGPIALD
jgi:hypothetical protein